MASRSPEVTYGPYGCNLPKRQHLASFQQHSYAQQNQFTISCAQNQTGQTSQYTPSISPTSPPTRRYTTPTLRQCSTTQNPITTSIAPNTLGQYTTTQNSINNEHPPSTIPSTLCLPTTNNVHNPSLSVSSLPTPPPAPAGLSSPNAASNFDLQDIIAHFGGQPELLKLIITSKIEEDKRKAEEAKLRVRQLDLMLCDRHRKCICHDESKNDEIHSNQDIDYENDCSIETCCTSDGTINNASFNTSSTSQQNLHSNRCKSAPQVNQTPLGQDNPTESEQCNNNCTSNNCTPNKRKRKRREMLPVTMIVETKEHPYVDNYLWKNNGNTTQRKTGNKSVYFKCSNSNKGCPVNKTVTEKEDGWTIKYRGDHLPECGKIKRISIPSPR